MAVRPIILWPEPWLNQKSEPVLPEEFGSPQLDELVLDLVDTMRAARGLGISAPQLSVHKRIIVVPHPEHLEKRGVVALCNPVLSEFTPEKRLCQEGCLSLPGVQVPVERPVSVKVTAKLVDGTDYEGVWTGLCAVAVQHECDHLEGKTIADGVGPVRMQLIRSKLKKTLRELRRSQSKAREVSLRAKKERTSPSDYTLTAKP